MLHRQSIAAVTPEEYRDAMSRYGGHVQIVTAEVEGERRGMTATAACSVSDSPPTILVCINHSNAKNELFFRASSFALNTLSTRHQPLADAFSGLGPLDEEERFARGEWETIATGAPTLIGARAVFDCRVLELKPMSTHTIIFGQVVGLRLGARDPALLYLDRRYQEI